MQDHALKVRGVASLGVCRTLKGIVAKKWEIVAISPQIRGPIVNGHVEGLITPENERQQNAMIYNDLFCTFMATI